MSEQDRDQRTEQATPQRIRKALEDGQVGFSSELVGGIMLTTSAIYFLMLGEWMFGTIGLTIQNRVTHFEPMIIDTNMIGNAILNDTLQIGMVCLALVIPLFLVALGSGVMQTNFNISFKPLELKPDKLSIFKGFKRIFSISSVVRGALSIVKAAVVIGIICLIARARLDQIAISGFATFQMLMFSMCEILIFVALAIAATIGVIGLLDLAFQKWKHLQDLKMSVQDIRDEYKENEGDPMLKARLRRLQGEMRDSRSIQKVADADALITNPTHFAIAIKYDRDTMDAPIVLAKGSDELAQRMMKFAKENKVPIVQRTPVARFLWFNIEEGQAVPVQLYQALAEILNYVNGLKRSA